MLETIHHLKIMKMKPPICIGVHGIFSGDAYSELLNSGADSIITCNTIKHASNAIDLSSILIHTLKDLQ
jgi:ribose-phosphate pyrophosphokinase